MTGKSSDQGFYAQCCLHSMQCSCPSQHAGGCPPAPWRSLVLLFPWKPDASGNFNLWKKPRMLKKKSRLCNVSMLVASTLGFAKGKAQDGVVGTKSVHPCIPFPKLPLCLVPGTPAEMELKMGPDGQRRLPNEWWVLEGLWWGQRSVGWAGVWGKKGRAEREGGRLQKDRSIKKHRLGTGHLMTISKVTSLLQGWQADGCCRICQTAPLIKAVGSLPIAPPALPAHRCCNGLVLFYIAMTHFSHSKPNFVCQLWGILAQLCNEVLSAPIRCPSMLQHGQWLRPWPTAVSLPRLCPGASSGLPASLFVSSSDAVILTNSSHFFFFLLAVVLKLKWRKIEGRGKKISAYSFILILRHRF